MTNKERQRTTWYSDGVLFLHEETYTCDTTYFDMGQLLSGGMLCMLSARTVSRVYFIRLSIERFTHEGIFNLCHDF